jgi:hypothetical protein
MSAIPRMTTTSQTTSALTAANTISKTMPQTTAAIRQTGATATGSANTGTGTGTSAPSCGNIYIPDYSVLRQQNLDKVNEYYNKLLGSYTSTYNQYATQSKGTKNDQNYANVVLLPKYTDYNTQLINLNQSMIKSVNQDMDLIAAQKDELTNKTRQIDTIMNNITLLKDKDNEMTVLTGARKDSLSSASDGLEQMNFSTYIFIGINILILLVILGLVIYIVYSSYSAGTRARSANNLYSGITRNN